MNKFYEKYWEDTEDHLGDFDLKWPKLKKLIPTEENITIVDFGCGQGRIIKEMRKINSTAKYIGLDVSENALQKARNIITDAEFKKISDGEELPLEDNTADFVFSSEVIEHIYDTENAAREISRITKPGGKLLLTTPYHGFVKNLLITIFSFNRHFDPTGPHIRFFTKKTLFDLLERNGFGIEKYGYYGRFWPIPHSIYVLAVKK